MKSLYLIIFFYFLIFFTQKSYSQNAVENLEIKILNGDLESAEIEIDNLLKKSKSSGKEKIKLFQLKGDLYKAQGDFDEAFLWWQKSNNLRTKLYSKNDYHLVWNYANLSHFYFEKINIPLSIQYADSCQILLTTLNEKQKLEIEIFKIWNILGQTYKNRNASSVIDFEKKHNLTKKYYLNSLLFIQKHKLNKYYLGKTKHLLANSYFDKSWFYGHVIIDQEKAIDNFNKAIDTYHENIDFWKNNFGENYFEVAKTHQLKGMLYLFNDNKQIKNRLKIAEQNFKKALTIYRFSPNKGDLLMCLKYATVNKFDLFKKKKEYIYLKDAEKLNVIAIKTWDKYYKNQKSKNTNQNLAIFRLNPFEELIEIQRLKSIHLNKINKIETFRASQMLKYYDFDKYGHKLNLNNASLRTLQNKLKEDELFIDFFVREEYACMSYISKNKMEVRFIDKKINDIVPKLIEAICNFDYSNYTALAFQFKINLFKEINLKQYSKIIICPDGNFNKLPFEALLNSTNNFASKDYRKLDYLFNHHDFEFCFNANLFRKHEARISNISLDFFSPTNPKLKLSDLPFSRKLANYLKGTKNITSFKSLQATKEKFLSSKASILHLSSHALIDLENSSNSRLVFSDTTLLFSEIYKSNFNQNLIVLNTCNSSLGKTYIGDGVDGFERAFHAAGVKNTISNLWEVDDKVSNQLFGSFYEQLQDEKSTQLALRLAKHKQISEAKSSLLASPFYWAGHRLIGLDEITEFEKKYNFWITFGLIIVGVTIVIWRIKPSKPKRKRF